MQLSIAFHVRLFGKSLGNAWSAKLPFLLSGNRVALDINLTSAFNSVRSVLSHTVLARHGRITLIGSSAVYSGGRTSLLLRSCNDKIWVGRSTMLVGHRLSGRFRMMMASGLTMIVNRQSSGRFRPTGPRRTQQGVAA